MNEEKETLILEDFDDESEAVRKLKVGSEDWARGRKALTDQYRASIEELKLSADLTDKLARFELDERKVQNEERDMDIRERELDIKEKEIENEKKKNILEFVKTAIFVVGGVGLTFLNFAYDTKDSLQDKERGGIIKDIWRRFK